MRNPVLMKRVLLPLLLCFSNGYGNAASTIEKHLPVDSWVSFHSEYYKIECDRQMSQAAPTEQRGRAISGEEFFCNCAPAGLKAYADSLLPESRKNPVSLNTFANLLHPAVEAKCLAAHLRSTIYADCLSNKLPLPVGATDRESFCQCVLTQFRTAPETGIRNAAKATQTELDNAEEAMQNGSMSKLPGNNELIIQILNKCSNQ